jgi:UDP-N-acetylglucosamine:LPS N-acetylglucosamine transferase
MSRRRLLFVTYGGGHVNALLPVIQYLRKHRPEFELHVLGLTTAAAKLAAAGIPALGFRDFVEPQDARALARGRDLARDLPPGQVAPEESVAYLGISYQELVEELGEAAAAERYADVGRFAFLPVKFLRRVLDRVRPDLLIATNSPRAERASIIAARQRGIPAICLGDLFLGFEMEWLRSNDYADRLLVLCESVKDRLIAAGRTPSHIVVTGNPAFDALAEPRWEQVAQDLRRTRGWEGRKVVLWMSHTMPWFPPARDEICNALIAAAQRHPEWQLVLRTHPSEPPLAQALPENVAQSDPHTQPPAAILRATDVGVTMLSTMGLEAILLGVPMVTTAIAPPVKPTFIDLDYENYLRRMGLAVVATTLEEIEPAICMALQTRPDHRSALPPLGTATQAVAAQICELLGIS